MGSSTCARPSRRLPRRLCLGDFCGFVNLAVAVAGHGMDTVVAIHTRTISYDMIWYSELMWMESIRWFPFICLLARWKGFTKVTKFNR
jgi:hypothetical protein